MQAGSISIRLSPNLCLPQLRWWLCHVRPASDWLLLWLVVVLVVKFMETKKFFMFNYICNLNLPDMGNDVTFVIVIMLVYLLYGQPLKQT